MLRGHVDVISSTLLKGWAVDTARPDDRADICIYFDDCKLVEFTCNQPRQDLVGREGFGNGRHGFQYEPSPPLTGFFPQRVTIRHASTGTVLGNGEVVLNLGTSIPPTDRDTDVEPGLERLPAPETLREMFALLSHYVREKGIGDLIRR